MKDLPDTEKLIDAGVMLAGRLSLPPPSREEYQKKIEEIFFERKNYEGALQGLITHREAVNLIIQHFQTLICRLAGAEEPSTAYDVEDIVNKSEKALLG